MSDRIRNDKGQFSLAEESAGDPSVQETPSVQEKPERETDILNTEATEHKPAQHSTNRAQYTTSPLSIGTTATSQHTAIVTVALASYAKSEVAIFLQGLIKQGIIIEGHATYLLDIYVFM